MLGGSQFDSDAGWGCMIRCGQMLMARALQMKLLMLDDRRQSEARVQVIKMFLDTASSQYSIQNLCAVASQYYGKAERTWHGPSTIANVLKHLCNSGLDIDNAVQMDSALLQGQLRVVISQDSTLYLDQMSEIIQDGNSLLVLVPTRLGIDQVNQIYHDSIRLCLTCRWSVGIAGGKPNSAFYFVGLETRDNLLYLDPHIVQDAVSLSQDGSMADTDLATYSQRVPKSLDISRLDPSMLLGFYIHDEEELMEFYAYFKTDDDDDDDDAHTSSVKKKRRQVHAFKIMKKFVDFDDAIDDVLDESEFEHTEDEEMESKPAACNDQLSDSEC
ncbi:hypothetical protein MIR68_005048 [Amoeboaphelidium protococcarum]|nr:hypothetical protein MIR68_005048 [Amoeboaphelidium protococcarum]